MAGGSFFYAKNASRGKIVKTLRGVAKSSELSKKKRWQVKGGWQAGLLVFEG